MNYNDSACYKGEEQNASTHLNQQDIQAAIEDAHHACQTTGNSSRECAAAWDVVEEMQATLAHRQQLQRNTNYWDSYCQERPGAEECLIYDL